MGRDLVARHGLLRGLWQPGCVAHMSAVYFSSGVRLGFYPYVRDVIAGPNEKDMAHMWLAGFATGAIGFWAANPFFQAKVRIQSLDSSLSTWQCLKSIVRQEGWSALYRGSTICMLRGAMLNAGAQLGYDSTKTYGLKYHWVQNDGPMLHFMSSIISAFSASLCCGPVDFLFTQYQSAPLKGKSYSGIGNCAYSIVSTEGVMCFYRGFMPLFTRLSLVFCLNMPLYEQVRKLFGLSYLN